MLAFINKYWKVIIIVLLLINIGLLVKQELTNRDNNELRLEMSRRIEENNRNIKTSEKIVADLKKYLKDSTQVKVITTTENYETIKTAPLNTNITDKQLRDKLQKLESKYNKRKK